MKRHDRIDRVTKALSYYYKHASIRSRKGISLADISKRFDLDLNLLETAYKKRCIRALRNYYKAFDTKRSRSLAGCAVEQKVFYNELVSFMVDQLHVGMPDTKEEAKKFLKRLYLYRLK